MNSPGGRGHACFDSPGEALGSIATNRVRPKRVRNSDLRLHLRNGKTALGSLVAAVGKSGSQLYTAEPSAEYLQGAEDSMTSVPRMITRLWAVLLDFTRAFSCARKHNLGSVSLVSTKGLAGIMLYHTESMHACTCIHRHTCMHMYTYSMSVSESISISTL